MVCSSQNNRLLEFLKPPKEKLLTIGNYKKTDRLHIIVEKPCMKRLRELVENLDIPLDAFLQETIKEKCREMKALKPENIEALRALLKKANKKLIFHQQTGHLRGF